MKKKIKTTFAKVLNSILDYMDDIPAPVIGRFGNALQMIGVGLFVPAVLGVAVSSQYGVLVGEAFIVGITSLVFLAYGTILDIKASK